MHRNRGRGRVGRHDIRHGYPASCGASAGRDDKARAECIPIVRQSVAARHPQFGLSSLAQQRIPVVEPLSDGEERVEKVRSYVKPNANRRISFEEDRATSRASLSYSEECAAARRKEEKLIRDLFETSPSPAKKPSTSSKPPPANPTPLLFQKLKSGPGSQNRSDIATSRVPKRPAGPDVPFPCHKKPTIQQPSTSTDAELRMKLQLEQELSRNAEKITHRPAMSNAELQKKQHGVTKATKPTEPAPVRDYPRSTAGVPKTSKPARPCVTTKKPVEPHKISAPGQNPKEKAKPAKHPLPPESIPKPLSKPPSTSSVRDRSESPVVRPPTRRRRPIIESDDEEEAEVQTNVPAPASVNENCPPPPPVAREEETPKEHDQACYDYTSENLLRRTDEEETETRIAGYMFEGPPVESDAWKEKLKSIKREPREVEVDMETENQPVENAREEEVDVETVSQSAETAREEKVDVETVSQSAETAQEEETTHEEQTEINRESQDDNLCQQSIEVAREKEDERAGPPEGLGMEAPETSEEVTLEREESLEEGECETDAARVDMEEDLEGHREERREEEERSEDVTTEDSRPQDLFASSTPLCPAAPPGSCSPAAAMTSMTISPALPSEATNSESASPVLEHMGELRIASRQSISTDCSSELASPHDGSTAPLEGCTGWSCRLCHNHGKYSKPNHKDCEFRECPCDKCSRHRQRRCQQKQSRMKAAVLKRKCAETNAAGPVPSAVKPPTPPIRSTMDSLFDVVANAVAEALQQDPAIEKQVQQQPRQPAPPPPPPPPLDVPTAPIIQPPSGYWSWLAMPPAMPPAAPVQQWQMPPHPLGPPPPWMFTANQMMPSTALPQFLPDQFAPVNSNNNQPFLHGGVVTDFSKPPPPMPPRPPPQQTTDAEPQRHVQDENSMACEEQEPRPGSSMTEGFINDELWDEPAEMKRPLRIKRELVEEDGGDGHEPAGNGRPAFSFPFTC